MPVNESLLHNWFYGNHGVRVAAALIFAFLICSIPIGPIVGWLFSGLDARLQRVAGTIVPFLNALKGFIATVIAVHGGGEFVGLWTAFAATLGHAYSPWRRFKGEETIDAQLGILIALQPIVAVFFALFFAVAGLPMRSRQIGTLFASALLFLPLWFFGGPAAALYGIAAGTAIALRLRISGQLL